jgi:hypothetical protein
MMPPVVAPALTASASRSRSSPSITAGNISPVGPRVRMMALTSSSVNPASFNCRIAPAAASRSGRRPMTTVPAGAGLGSLRAPMLHLPLQPFVVRPEHRHGDHSPSPMPYE